MTINKIREQMDAIRKQIKQELEKVERHLLSERLEQLSPDQRQKFDRIFSNGVDTEDVLYAIELCDRTIKKSVTDSQVVNLCASKPRRITL